MKRILVALLALCLLFCTASAEEKLDLNDLSETITITVQSNSQNRPARNLEDDYIRQELQKRLNIDLQLVCKPTNEYYTALNMQISGGDVPDIFMVNETQYETFAPSGLFLNLKPYLDQMPYYTTAFPGIGENESLLYDGALYLIGNGSLRGADQAVPSFQSMWIRQDWLDTLGLEVPTTLDELYDVCYAFTYQDPDGNGLDDTVGFSGFRDGAQGYASMFPFVYGAYGVGEPTSYILTDDGVKLSAELEGTKEALAYIKKMVDDGLVDPDVLAYSDYNQFNEMVYRNKVGVIYYSWAVFIKSQFGEQLRELCPGANWQQFATVAGPNGDRALENYKVPGSRRYGYVVGAHVAKDPAKLARVLKYLDYISDGEGLRLVCYGIEGEHYTVGEDGSIFVDTSRASETENAAQHQICDRKEREYLLTKFADIRKEVEFAAQEPRINDYIQYLPNVDGLNKADWERYITENVIKFIYGNRPLEEYDGFLEKLYQTYGQEQYNAAIHDSLVKAGILK